jgi:hypothetical protein
MDLFIRRIRWAWQAWPLWVLIVVAALTLYFGNWTPTPSSLKFNKFAAATMQGLGALLVLLSIDGNLGLFRGHGVFAEMREYLLTYPRRQKSLTLVAASCGQANASGSLASVRVRPTDIEGRVEALEKLFAELEVQVSEQRAEMLNRIHEVRNENREALNIHTQRVNDVAKKVEETAVGGMKLQAFGVGLALMGSVLSVYS